MDDEQAKKMMVRSVHALAPRIHEFIEPLGFVDTIVLQALLHNVAHRVVTMFEREGPQRTGVPLRAMIHSAMDDLVKAMAEKRGVNVDDWNRMDEGESHG